MKRLQEPTLSPLPLIQLALQIRLYVKYDIYFYVTFSNNTATLHPTGLETTLTTATATRAILSAEIFSFWTMQCLILKPLSANNDVTPSCIP